MFTRRPLFDKTPEHLPKSKLPLIEDGASQRRLAPSVEITSLEIEPDYGLDCDPYNQTGQHFVIKEKKD